MVAHIPFGIHANASALMIACGAGHEQVVRQLLAAGADADATDNFGRKAATYASASRSRTLPGVLAGAPGNRSMEPGGRRN
ncbi:hypothetical protein DIPPA_20703 [Diplonema papillatum]|nr:hypothetical protein DIPPA_20703 [Diplonema papillatum]